MYSTGTRSVPMLVTVGDLNNDGWLDFVVADDDSGNIVVFLGFGNGTFSSETTYSIGDPTCIVVADLNKDGHLDIIVSDFWSSTIVMFLGFGNGTFSGQTTYPVGIFSGPMAIAIGDFNNDRWLDIVVANYLSNNIGILLGYDNGTFASVITYPTGSNSLPRSVAVGDFNNDNRLDIVVANEATGNVGNVGVFVGYGNGTFPIMITYSTGNRSDPISVIVGDFNNDGRLDIAVANSGTDNIGLIFGNGDGTFSNQTTYPTGSGSRPYSIAIGDFNNDNQLDIAIANQGSNGFGVFLGRGNGTFFNQLNYFIGDGSLPVSIAVGDFNNDGRLDIIITGTGTDNVGVFLGYVSESFLSTPAYSIGLFSRPTSIAVGDFDNDNLLDVVIANNGTDNIMVLFGSGYGTFISHTPYSTGNDSHPCWVAVGDFNNDSRLDIVVANSGTNNIGIFLSNGSGTFSSQITYPTGPDSQPNSVAVLDFDNDTRLDIAVANYGSNSVGVFFGYGNGSFSSQLIFNTGFDSHPFAVVVGDVNNDNLTDIIVTNNGYGNIDILFKEC
jgi:hypothetical protein